jgi:transcription elongation factor B subunit 1
MMPTETAGVTSSSATPPNIYGGLEGPESMYLKLISSDQHEFVVRRDFAVIASPTIKNMLSGPGQYSESQPNEIYLKDIPSHVLINVCRYFAYKAKYTKYEI